jgi:hypothetical protein
MESNKKYNLPREGKKRWTVKYKKSIDCNGPKGFSQKSIVKGKNKAGNIRKINNASNS